MIVFGGMNVAFFVTLLILNSRNKRISISWPDC